MFLPDGVGIAREAPGTLRPANRGAAPGIAAMVQEDGLEVRVMGQQADEFRATVSVMSDNADELHVYLCVVVNNYTIRARR
jgi:hypothetical protein